MVCYGISGVVNFETASQGLGLRFSENRDVFQIKKFNMYAAIALRLLSKDIKYSEQKASANPEANIMWNFSES